MFMLFGLEKEALLLVFVLLLARTAHLKILTQLNAEREGQDSLVFALSLRAPHLASELSKAYVEVPRH